VDRTRTAEALLQNLPLVSAVGFGTSLQNAAKDMKTS